MKTIEEKRTALLAECATLCPKEGDKINILGDVALISNCGDSIWKLDWKYMDGKIWMCDTLPDWLVDVVYRILGLAERDAVAAYKASLQSDLKSMTSIVSSVKKGEQPDYVHVSKLEELQANHRQVLGLANHTIKQMGENIEHLKARNAALVAALEEINNVPTKIQETIDIYKESAYQLKTDSELVGKISEFGFGELEFHTADIERLVTQSGIAFNALAATEKGGVQG